MSATSQLVLPSVSTLAASDDAKLLWELRIASVREQTALVRALLDDVDRHFRGSIARECMRQQLVEELARLGCRVLEMAAAMSKTVDFETAKPLRAVPMPHVAA